MVGSGRTRIAFAVVRPQPKSAATVPIISACQPSSASSSITSSRCEIVLKKSAPLISIELTTLTVEAFVAAAGM